MYLYKPITVKHSFSEHANNELMLTAKSFSFPMILFFYVVNLTGIMNYTNNEAKSPVPATPLKACFTV